MMMTIDFSKGGTLDKFGNIINPSFVSVLCEEAEENQKECHIYLLTENGKIYNEDELISIRDFLMTTNMINNKNEIFDTTWLVNLDHVKNTIQDRDIIFSMGRDLNDPYILTSLIESMEDYVIIWSTDNYIFPIGLDLFIEIFKNELAARENICAYDEKQTLFSSWEFFCLHFLFQ